ncbi:MAG: succinate dehydrogenase iron-sulfur subunit [Gemmatimonadetes bacterium]|nr:succinate dehydrogenase iron-sulfur subunit [Gemmatimonadota bacterium]
MEIRRYRPEEEAEPTWQRYEVPFWREWMVLDALNYIKDHVDGTLSFRWSCRMGVCGSCGMMVNGNPALTCATYLETLVPGPVQVEPLRGFPVIRDLVCDLTDFITKLQRVQPWIVRETEGTPAQGEYRQTPDELAAYRPYAMCINCLLCYAACPIYELEPGFLGPAVIALAQRYNLDSRDQGREARMDVLSEHDGIWACTLVGECSTVCPKHVDPAGAIQRYKLDAAVAWVKALVLPRSGR